MASKVEIEIVAKDMASGEIRKVSDEVTKLGSNTISTFDKIKNIAFGVLARDAIRGFLGEIHSLADEIYNTQANFERYDLQIQSFVAREMAQGKVVEQTTQVTKALTAAEKDRASALELSIQKINNANESQYATVTKLQAQIEAELARKGGPRPGYIEGFQAAIEKANIAIEENNAKLASNRAEYDKLNDSIGQTVDIVQKVVEGRTTVSDVLATRGEEVAKQTKALMDELKRVAIESPFTIEGVLSTFKTATAFGLPIEQARELTKALVDMAAASGFDESVLDRLALALGQVRQLGKLAGQEVRQFANAGVNVYDILSRTPGPFFGKTTAQLREMQAAGELVADQVLPAIIHALEADYGGAAKRIAFTFAGIKSTLSDIKTFGLQAFFQGTFKAIEPYVSSFVQSLASEESFNGIQKVGDALGNSVAKNIERIISTKDKLKAVFDIFKGDFLSKGTEVTKLVAAGFGVQQAADIQSFVASIRDLGGEIRSNLNPAFDALNNLAGKFRQVLDPIKSQLIAMARDVPGVLREIMSGQFDFAGIDIKRGAENLASTIGNAILNVLPKNISDGIRGAISNIAGPLSEELSKIVGTVGGDLSSGFGRLKEVLGERIGAPLLESIKDIRDKLPGVIDTIITKFGELQGKASPYLDGVKTKIGELYSTIRTELSRGIESIPELNMIGAKIRDAIFGSITTRGGEVTEVSGLIPNLQGMLKPITDELPGAINTAKATISTAIDDIKTKFDELTPRVNDFVKAFRDEMPGAMSAFAASAKEGIPDKLDTLATSLGKVVEHFGPFSDELIKNGPDIANNIKTIADNLAGEGGLVLLLAGLATKLALANPLLAAFFTIVTVSPEAIPAVARDLTQLAAGITGVADAVGERATGKSDPSTFLEKLTKSLRDFSLGAATLVSDVLRAILGTIGKIIDSIAGTNISGLVNEVFDGINKSIKESADKLLPTIGDGKIATNIGNFFSGIEDTLTTHQKNMTTIGEKAGATDKNVLANITSGLAEAGSNLDKAQANFATSVGKIGDKVFGPFKEDTNEILTKINEINETAAKPVNLRMDVGKAQQDLDTFVQNLAKQPPVKIQMDSTDAQMKLDDLVTKVDTLNTKKVSIDASETNLALDDVLRRTADISATNLDINTAAIETKLSNVQGDIETAQNSLRSTSSIDPFYTAKNSADSLISKLGGIQSAASGAASALEELNSGVAERLGTLYNQASSVTTVVNSDSGNGSSRVGGPQGFASGVKNFVGGLAIVGENGPELVKLPAGSNVYTNQETQSMAKEILPQSYTNNVDLKIYATVSGQMDLETLTYQIAKRLAAKNEAAPRKLEATPK